MKNKVEIYLLNWIYIQQYKIDYLVLREKRNKAIAILI